MPKAAIPLTPSASRKPKPPVVEAEAAHTPAPTATHVQSKAKPSLPLPPIHKPKPAPKPSPQPAPSDEDEEQAERDTDIHSIPLPDVLNDEISARVATDLLTEANEIKQRHDKDDLRLKQIRTQLCGMAETFDVPGLRYGSIAFVYGGMRTLKRLDVKKLIENGVDPDTIRDSYTETKPFQASRLVKVKRP